MNREVERLLNLVWEVPSEQRAEFLVEKCPDPEVRAEVESLLSHSAGAECHFRASIGSVAHSLQNRHEPVPGDMIGRYRIVCLIGRGGMGGVYLAERADGEIRQRVAVKLLRADRHESRWIEQFRKERRLLASLQHPSIVHVIDAGHTGDGRPFLVMEYVDGLAIDVYSASLGVKQRLSLFLRVCEGLSHAHRRRVIHRDLKPSNILVDQSGLPKLLDFGIARFLDEAGDTETAEHWLTPNYASPEQVAGSAQTIATDVYSLGALLYKLLAGVAPPSNASNSAKKATAPPSDFNPDVPRDADFIVGKALRAEPGDRYVSVDDFAGDVRAALEFRPVRARSGSAWYRARRFLRSYRMPAIAAGLALASLAAGPFMTIRQREFAERRLEYLRQLTNPGIDLDRALRAQPDFIDARRHLISLSLAYLESLALEVEGNPALAEEIVEANWRLGRIQGVSAEPNLDDPATVEE